jgi:hypothetical protein
MLYFTLKHIKQTNKQTLLVFICFALLINISCGKRKPPLPPLEKVAQRVEISGFQRGDKVLILWTMATRNAPDGSLLNINRADIYRLAESIKSSASISEEEFASRSTLIATLPISDTDFGRKQLTFTDTLNFAGQAARLRYAVRFVNGSGQKAAFSNFFLIEPTASVADIPRDANLKVSQNAILLNWNTPDKNIDGSVPPNILGYNVYRLDEKSNLKILNNQPITKTEFADKFFEFEKTYTYFIRTVSLGTDSEPVESSDSKTIKIIPKDTFPPISPSAITIAASPNIISIFFAANPENDVAGYKVYRSTAPNQPKSDWTLLTPELLIKNTFQDTNVESGKKYFYYLTAIDNFGNVSEISEVVSETVP